MEALSLAKRIAELDRYDALRLQLLGYYSRGVRTTARTLVRYAMEPVSNQHDLLQLEALRIEESRSETELRSSAEQIERILEEHQKAGESHLTTLHENLNSTTRVLQSVLAQMAGSGAAHHDALEADLSRLREIGQINEITRLKKELDATAAQLADRMVSMRREYQLIVTQLRDEIRTLHHELDERTVSRHVPEPQSDARPDTSKPTQETVNKPSIQLEESDAAPGMKRSEFEEVLKVKAEQGEAYSLIVILLSNLADLFTRFEPALVLALMDSSARRTIDGFVGNPFWIRWEDDCFILCSHYRGVAARTWAYDLADRLSGSRRVSVDGNAVNLPLQVSAATIDSAPSETPDSILNRAGELIRSLRAAV